jgi:hypothetical protein
MSCGALHPNITTFCERRKGHKGMHQCVLKWGTVKEYEEEHKECKHQWSYCYNAEKPNKRCIKCGETNYL